MIGRIPVFCIGVLLCGAAIAEDVSSNFSKTVSTNISENKVTMFFNNLKTLTADFEQVVQNAQMGSTEKAGGKLWIERPGKFRWDYTSPYEQQIVSDGNKLWIFDKDLEQVTVRPISLSMGNTPAVLLSDSKPITDTFIIKDVGFEVELDWVKLFPKDPEASFTAIRLGFNNDVLSEMLLEDNLGQTTRLSFSHLKRNAKISPQKFVFTPPDGVDIFETSD
ncbi:MAG: outer membrane lipoprotein chaperone LolA [Gammaproteobacteria bacterium]|nr:outer membrane lipoprotein chaperone LolA [Gammaproteobacteria bacterium]